MLLKFLLTGHPFRAWRNLRWWWRLRFPKSPQQIHLGCGDRRLDGFVNVDVRYTRAVDFISRLQTLPCPPQSVSRIESYHVIEHIPHTEIGNVVSYWHKLLTPGGTVVAECPDFDRALEEYQLGNEYRVYNIFGLQRYPGDFHLFGYNRKRLTELFTKAGFVDCRVAAGTDYHAANEPCLRIECRKPDRPAGA